MLSVFDGLRSVTTLSVFVRLACAFICGGIIGIVLGCFASAVLGRFMLARQLQQNMYLPNVEQFTVLPSVGLVLGAFLFSALLGIIFGLYPTALIEWFRTYGHLLKPGCIFTDVSGVKTGLVEPVQAMCPAGVEFIASHPMAGRETSSVEHAAEVNFAPANFIITPTEKNTPAGIQWARELAEVLGFKHICTLTVQEHDRMIGYVSQLCHAIAVSLMCANDNSSLCEYTGDSFRDLTRIARINDKMWAELFLWNKQNLISEIDQFDSALQEMRAALVADDRDKLEQMFRLSTQRRAAFDKKLPE